MYITDNIGRSSKFGAHNSYSSLLFEAAAEGPDAPPGGISVGVGIATGAAFVGNIQSADRAIWTVLGNTTNLAARLENLTREMDAAMVIDQSTWRAAGEPPEFQLREQVAIRGRSEREDLYSLALGSTAYAYSTASA